MEYLRYIKPAVFTLAFTLSACGPNPDPDPSSSTGSGVIEVANETYGQLELGPVVGANISIQTVSGFELMFTTTDEDGTFTIDIDELRAVISRVGYDREIIKFVSFGGIDIDPNDDGISEENEAIPVVGSVTSYAELSTVLSRSGYKINMLGSVVADIVSSASPESITKEYIAEVAKEVGVQDIDGDGVITINDLVFYDMLANESNIEHQLRADYLPSLHSGDDESKLEFVQNTRLADSFIKIVEVSSSGGSKTLSFIMPSDAKLRYQVIDSNTDRDASEFLVYSGGNIQLDAGNSVLLLQECLPSRCGLIQQIYFVDGNMHRGYVASGNITEAVNDRIKAFEDVGKAIDVALDRVDQAKGELEQLAKDEEAINSQLDKV